MLNKMLSALALVGLLHATPAAEAAPRARQYKSVAWQIKAGLAAHFNTMFHQPATPWQAKDVKISTKKLTSSSSAAQRPGAPIVRAVTFNGQKEAIRYAGKAKANSWPGGGGTSLRDIAFDLQPRGLTPPPAAR